MPQKKAKVTTIEGLAGMVQRGFLYLEDRLGKRIDGVDNGIDSVDKRIDSLESKIDRGFAQIDQRFIELESRMSNLELRMKNIEERMEGIEEFNEEIGERLGRIEQLVDEDQQERIKRLENSMQRVFERLAFKN